MSREKSKLTPKQEKFCREYIVHLNGTQAAIKAGYSKKTANGMASENLAKPYIQARIAQLERKVVKKAELNAEYVLNGFMEIAERCMQRKPVMEKVDGKLVQAEDAETGEGIWKFDSSGANKALESLGRHLKLFTDKIEADVKGDMTFNMVVQSTERDEEK